MNSSDKTTGGNGFDSPEFQFLLDKLALLQRLLEAYPQAWGHIYPTAALQAEQDRTAIATFTINKLKEDFTTCATSFVATIEKHYNSSQLIRLDAMLKSDPTLLLDNPKISQIFKQVEKSNDD